MKKLLFIFNPQSGSGEICKRLAEVVDIFIKANYDVVVYSTQAPGDGKKKILAEGKDFDRIVVAGGDGTLNELVNAVMLLPKKVTVGYIPTGTVNDFATAHNLPKNNVIAAAKIAVSDYVVDVDVGKFENTYFSYVAAFGVATNVAYDTDQKAKKRWKFLAYFVNVVRSIVGPKKLKRACRKMTVDTGEMVLKGEFIFGAISNSHSIGGVKNFTDKEAVLNDGLLEGLFIPRPKTLKDWDQLKKGFLSRDFASSGLAFVRAKKFEIRCEPAAWTLDGENGGSHEHIVITAYKQSLSVALPDPDKTENA